MSKPERHSFITFVGGVAPPVSVIPTHAELVANLANPLLRWSALEIIAVKSHYEAEHASLLAAGAIPALLKSIIPLIENQAFANEAKEILLMLFFFHDVEKRIMLGSKHETFLLLELLSNKDDGIRKLAAEVLFIIVSAASVNPVLRPVSREQLPEAERWIPSLLPLLKSEDVALQGYAFEMLAKLLDIYSTHLDVAAFISTIAPLLQSQSETIRERAVMFFLKLALYKEPLITEDTIIMALCQLAHKFRYGGSDAWKVVANLKQNRIMGDRVAKIDTAREELVILLQLLYFPSDASLDGGGCARRFLFLVHAHEWIRPLLADAEGAILVRNWLTANESNDSINASYKETMQEILSIFEGTTIPRESPRPR